MAEEPPTWAVIESHVDYYAATTPDPKLGDWCYELARDIIEAERLGDFDGAGKSEQGYAGIASEHSFAGQRDDGTYVRFSSLGASYNWLQFRDAGMRTSRIDVCLTGTADRDVPSVAYSMRYGDRLPSRLRGRLPGRTFISSEDSGDTCYVGSAGSDQRGRVYDKTRESKGAYPVGTWRFEVQCRHAIGNALGRDLGRRERIDRGIESFVSAWYADRGIVLPIPRIGEGWRPKVVKQPTDDAARVAFLRHSIRPMLRRMTVWHSIRELREILGLQYDKHVDQGRPRT